MLSFKAFLESEYGPITSVKDPISIIEKNPKVLDALEIGHVLWRGMTYDAGDFSISSSRGTRRTSRETSNIYQILMDASDALKEYPSRSESMICSTSLLSAKEYASHGLIYMVLPLGNPTLAVSDDRDFIYTHIKIDNKGSKQTTRKIAGIDSSIQRILNNLGIKSQTEKDKFLSIEQLDSDLSKFDLSDPDIENDLVSLSRTPDEDIIIDLMQKLPPNKIMSSLSNTIMTPERLRLHKASFGSALPHDVEVWFSGEALFLKTKAFLRIVDELESKGHKISQQLKDKVDRMSLL